MPRKDSSPNADFPFHVPYLVVTVGGPEEGRTGALFTRNVPAKVERVTSAIENLIIVVDKLQVKVDRSNEGFDCTY